MIDFDLPAFARELNSKAQSYRIGTLQQLRSELQRFQRRPGHDIFTWQTISDSRAFHHGGRKELQFNIGTHGTDGTMLRYGVAFSFQTSQSLPKIDPLIPKVRLFNEFLRLYPDLYSDMRMWHWSHGRSRSSESLAGPIPDEWVSEGEFVFLGHLASRRDLDGDRILAEMDRLLPLYEYVESKGRRHRLSPHEGQFVFRPGWKSRPEATKARYARQELHVNLRHNRLKKTLYDRLIKKHGEENVGEEVPTGIGTFVDMVVRQPNGYRFYEIKTYVTPRACIREAIGQLLEYALWPRAQEASQLIVVGETPADADVKEYCRRLNKRFSLPVQYQHIEV